MTRKQTEKLFESYCPFCNDFFTTTPVHDKRLEEINVLGKYILSYRNRIYCPVCNQDIGSKKWSEYDHDIVFAIYDLVYRNNVSSFEMLDNDQLIDIASAYDLCNSDREYLKSYLLERYKGK